MSSHCTVNRLVPWRVKDFASCFYACRFPLEEEREKLDFGSKGLTRKVSRKRKILKRIRDEDGKKGESSVGSNGNKSNNGGVRGIKESVVADSSWPHFEEEDYIVFCFKENGEIDMINDDGKRLPDEFVDEKYDKDYKDRTLRPTDIKVIEVDKKDTEWPPDEVNPNDEPRSHRLDSFESCDSNLSDASTSSFAFPVLGDGWIGSPVQMPKSEREWDGSVNFQCCRF